MGLAYHVPDTTKRKHVRCICDVKRETRHMTIAYLIARVLLGIIFVVFGLNGLLNFIPAPPLAGYIGEFTDAISKSHFMLLPALVQLVAGVLLLANRYVTLAVVLLGAVLANILMLHITMQPEGLPPALITTILWAIVAWHVRAQLAPIFSATPP
jgi:putative oxidoreductase